jgi:hypothetical protein
MERSKVLAIVTGAISIALALAYLAVVQFLDMRGEMIPAPMPSTAKGESASTLPLCLFKNMRFSGNLRLLARQKPEPRKRPG